MLGELLHRATKKRGIKHTFNFYINHLNNCMRSRVDALVSKKFVVASQSETNTGGLFRWFENVLPYKSKRKDKLHKRCCRNEEPSDLKPG